MTQFQTIHPTISVIVMDPGLTDRSSKKSLIDGRRYHHHLKRRFSSSVSPLNLLSSYIFDLPTPTNPALDLA